MTADINVTANFEDITSVRNIEFMEGGGGGTVDVAFDDTYIIYNPADNTTHGTQGYNGIKSDSSTTTSLIGIKEMFTEVPKSIINNEIVIDSAYLYLTKYTGGDSNNTLSVYSITTNWLTDAGTKKWCFRSKCRS